MMKKLFFILAGLSLLVFLFENNSDKTPTLGYREYSQKSILTSGDWHLDQAIVFDASDDKVEVKEKDITVKMNNKGEYKMKLKEDAGSKARKGNWQLSDSTLAWETISGKEQKGTIVTINDSLLVMEYPDAKDSTKTIKSTFKRVMQ